MERQHLLPRDELLSIRPDLGPPLAFYPGHASAFPITWYDESGERGQVMVGSKCYFVHLSPDRYAALPTFEPLTPEPD